MASCNVVPVSFRGSPAIFACIWADPVAVPFSLAAGEPADQNSNTSSDDMVHAPHHRPQPHPQGVQDDHAQTKHKDVEEQACKSDSMREQRNSERMGATFGPKKDYGSAKNQNEYEVG
jgi:hypothetical protein